MKKKLTCIICPMGCELNVDYDISKEYFDISGNKCNRGVVYAKSELTNPLRTLTTTIRVKNMSKSTVCVKTDKPIPKDKIFDALKIVKSYDISGKISVGDVLIKNILGTDSNIVATSKLDN